LHYNQLYRHLPVEKHSKRNIIRVIGEGNITVKPNRAEVTLGVTTEDKELQKAQQNSALIIEKIKNSLMALGIQEEQIRTIHYSVQPQYDFVEGKQAFRGYRVEHLLLISVENIENTGMIVDTAVHNGANTISGIAFTSTDNDYFERQALSAAVIDAFQKAEVIANTIKVQIIGPKLITENSAPISGPIPFQATAFLKSETTTPIQPGTMQFTSIVTVEFEFKN